MCTWVSYIIFTWLWTNAQTVFFFFFSNCLILRLYPFWYTAQRLGVLKDMSQGRKKHMARPGLEPRTSRRPWATEPCGRLVSISPCLIRFVTESARNHAGTYKTVPLLLAARARTPTLATKCNRGGKRKWPDRDSNPGPLADRTSTLTTELPSHTVDLWQLWHFGTGSE